MAGMLGGAQLLRGRVRSFSYSLSLFLLMTSIARAFVSRSASLSAPFTTFSSSSSFLPSLRAVSSLQELNETFLPFNQADKISLYSKSGKEYFLPTELVDASPEERWAFSQRRRQAQSSLRAAIANTSVKVAPYFKSYREISSVAEKCDILEANAAFFRANGEQDTEALRTIWSPSAQTMSLSPAAKVAICGTENILASQTAFWLKHSKAVHYKLRDVQLFYYGEYAVVTCIAAEEPLSSFSSLQPSKQQSSKSSKGSSVYYVTNAFERSSESGRYQLVSHTSSKYLQEQETEAARLRQTYSDPNKPKTRRENSRAPELMAHFPDGQVFDFSYSRDDDDDEDDDEDDEDEDEDEEDEDGEGGISLSGEGERSVQEMLTERIRNSLSQTMNKLVGGASGVSGIKSKVVILGGGNMDGVGFEELINNSRERGGGGGRSSSSLSQSNRRDEGDEDDEDDDDDEEEGEALAKILAARTLAAVQWLHARGRLSTHEKRTLTSDIVRNVGLARFSQAEVAYSLLIGGGRPGEWDLRAEGDNADLSDADEEDVDEFADACKSLVKRIDSAMGAS